MKEYQKTSTFTLWLGDDDVFYLRYTPGTFITIDLAKESNNAFQAANKEKPHGLLVLLDGIKGMDRNARVYFSGLGGPTAVALVGVSPIARVIGNLFLGLNKQTRLNVRIFSDEAEAAQWLKDFKA